jgi:hypothetical protein
LPSLEWLVIGFLVPTFALSHALPRFLTVNAPSRHLLYPVFHFVRQLSTSSSVSWCPGNIPSYSYLEDKAFRHGDIEDVIGKLAKALGGGFFGRSVKFTPLDVKRVYFGNWLRDCKPSRSLTVRHMTETADSTADSQAVDVGALQKTNLQTILNVVMVLGFLAHGYATSE